MNPAANLILVGPMGAGKSTLGKLLGEILGLRFVDLDQEIERQSGATVPLIFEIEGEPGFRDREARLLDELSAERGIVLATGGGAVLREDSRALIRQRGFVVWLKTSVELQWSRLRRDRSRPLLRTPNPLEKLRQMALLRDPIYASVADLCWPTTAARGPVSARQLATILPQHWQREPV